MADTSTPSSNGGAKSDGGAPAPKYDIWRDSLLRYLGYANEVGESFRPVAPRLVLPSYAVSFGYVLCDTIDKGGAARAEGRPVVKAAVDTLVWQTLASVALPGFVINRCVKLAAYGLAQPSAAAVVPKVAARWAPTAVGLAVIPVIIHPLDNFVHWAMDNTVRPWWLDVDGDGEPGP